MPTMPPFIGGESVEQRLPSRLLQIHVERGVDSQPTLVDLIAAVFRLQITPYVFHIVGGKGIRVFLQVERDRQSFCGGCLGWCDLAILEHGVQHEIAAPECAFGMGDRRIILRRFWKSGKQGGFFQGQLLRCITEVVFGSCFKAVSTVAEKYLISVKSEDLWFG